MYTQPHSMQQRTNQQWRECLKGLARAKTGKQNARIGGNNRSYPWQERIALVEPDSLSGEPQVQLEVSSADVLNSAVAVQAGDDAGSSTDDKIMHLLQVGPGF